MLQLNTSKAQPKDTIASRAKAQLLQQQFDKSTKRGKERPGWRFYMPAYIYKCSFTNATDGKSCSKIAEAKVFHHYTPDEGKAKDDSQLYYKHEHERVKKAEQRKEAFVRRYEEGLPQRRMGKVNGVVTVYENSGRQEMKHGKYVMTRVMEGQFYDRMPKHESHVPNFLSENKRNVHAASAVNSSLRRQQR